jgi:hypothetical protein
MIKINLTNISEYLITARNNNFSIFYIRPKSDFEKDIKNETTNISFQNEGLCSKIDIINMMKKSKFYTYFNNSYTEVIKVEENIKSYPNNSTKDNLEELPILNIK